MEQGLAADVDILAWARIHDCVVSALDADFHAILAVQSASNPSVIRIRLQGQDVTGIAKLLLRTIEQYEVELRREP